MEQHLKIKAMKFKIAVQLLLLLVLSQDLFAQESTSILIIANQNSKVLIDGDEIGSVGKGKPEKFQVNSGEHYLQIICLCPSQFEQNEVLNLEPNIQKVIKVEFESHTPKVKLKQTIAQFDFSIPGMMASATSDQPAANPRYYYAFESGDEVVLNLKMSNEKGTNQLKVFSYPDGRTVFAKDNFQDLKNVTFSVQSRGIYGFTFSTNHAFARDVSLTISRIPASEETVNFNSEVILKDIYSTVIIQQAQNFFINGGSKATFGDGKSRVTIPVTLPENVVKWYYEFTAERSETENEGTKQLLNLGSDLLYLVDQTGTLSFGIDQITQPPGRDYCDVYLIDHNNLHKFTSKLEFSHYPVGTRENFKSGIVEIEYSWDTPIYLAIRNPSSFYGINVAIEVVAIVKEQQLVMLQEE
jgi:hypothetical protein